MKRLFVLTVMSALLSFACNSEEGPGPDAGVDGGIDSGPPPRDAGPPPTDSGLGPGDPCEATAEQALDVVGCNGGLFGGTPASNRIGGGCYVPELMDGGTATLGSCMAPNPPAGAICVPTDPARIADGGPENRDGGTEVLVPGTCLYFCPPADEYITTSGCPAGSRCFRLSERLGLCFRDCESDTDCFDGERCDGEGSCLPMPPPDPDGGLMAIDAGAVGGIDGGA